jgi:hypothetical protein
MIKGNECSLLLVYRVSRETEERLIVKRVPPILEATSENQVQSERYFDNYNE